VQLVKVLAKFFWKINPQYINAEEGYEQHINGTSAGLIIGDRNFFLKEKHHYVLDLAEQWKLFTGMPFVFACWVIKKSIGTHQSEAFYKALEYGIENKNKVIQELDAKHDKAWMSTYLTNYIAYYLDNYMQEAMNLFFKLADKVSEKATREVPTQA
jgi:chorismate dehydratase